MSIIAIDKPDNYFNDLSKCTLYLEALYKKKTYGYAAVNIKNEDASIHLQIIKWSVEIRKEIMKDWNQIITLLKINNCTNISIANPDYQDKRWGKFIKLFGFSEPKIIQFSQMRL